MSRTESQIHEKSLTDFCPLKIKRKEELLPSRETILSEKATGIV